ncbi:hypothetical protein CRUP_009107 [Coryphaenoides rupestris]|nr:hypothetical protein CRUP_009107 [Coryphaenoides rupestris]
MDVLNPDYLEARSPYDYTFNFWNDYLGLSTLVTMKPPAELAMGPGEPNSITQSLKASLGLEDSRHPAAAQSPSPSPGPCPCVTADCCCCCCPPSSSSSSSSILELKERFSILSPFQSPFFGAPPPDRDRDRDAVGFGGRFDLRRSVRKSVKQEPKICVFCRNNGAPEEVFGSHVLKTPEGRVVCPILRAYTCPLCSANGDTAHTIKYCPLSKEQQQQPPPQRPLKGGRAVGGKRLKIF